MSPELQATAARPRLLFVDDEQRVLNSMRVMFRRQFDLFLASRGAEALRIIKSKDIDVIVADHRMPEMTGVEVLSKVRSLSPRTVRILLTGYADLDAVEGSINDSEVFRFLTKPCAPQQLRETIELAARLAREAPVPPTRNDERELGPEETLEIVMDGDGAVEIPQRRASTPQHPTAATSARANLLQPSQPPTSIRATPKSRAGTGLGVIVFSSDTEVLDTVQQAVRGRLPVYRATNIVQVVRTLTEHRPGVLVTDVSNDKTTIQSMTARLKEHLPELVTITVSDHRDVLDMVWLINHGQVFRFLRKPLSPGRCAVSLQAALQHHRALLRNPALARRHEVETAPPDSSLVDGMLAKLRSMKRLWAS